MGVDSRVLSTPNPPTNLGTASIHCAREKSCKDPAILVFFSFPTEFLVVLLFLFLPPSLYAPLHGYLSSFFPSMNTSLEQGQSEPVWPLLSYLHLQMSETTALILGYMLSTPVHKASSLNSSYDMVLGKCMALFNLLYYSGLHIFLYRVFSHFPLAVLEIEPRTRVREQVLCSKLPLKLFLYFSLL